MAVITRERYTLDDARRRREPREYAQNILRAAKSALMTSTYNQLFLIYNGLDFEFQRDLTMPSPETKLDRFLQEMDSKRDIWWALGNRRGGSHGNIGQPRLTNREQNQRYDRNDRNTDGRYSNSDGFNRQDFFRPGLSPQFSPQFLSYNQFPSGNQYQNRAYQYPNQSPSNQPSNAKALPSVPVPKQITAGPANASGSSQPNQRQPFRPFNNGGRPQRAYHDQPSDRYEEAFTNDEGYYDNDEQPDQENAHFAINEEFESTEDSNMKADVNFVTTPSAVPFPCRRCHEEFSSNNKLHAHVRKCRKSVNEVKANHSTIMRESKAFILESFASSNQESGFGFRS